MTGYLFYWNAILERNAINRASMASDPAGIQLADAKLADLCPSLYCTSIKGAFRCLFYNGWSLRYYLRDMLIHGDSRAAVVVSVDPLLIACYSDDLDGVCLLAFNQQYVSTYNLRVGSRLLTVLNAFAGVGPVDKSSRARDLVQGEMASPNYFNFWPLVAEFLSDDLAAIDFRKSRIAEEEYLRCHAMGECHLKKFGGKARSGQPDSSMRPMPWSETYPFTEDGSQVGPAMADLPKDTLPPAEVARRAAWFHEYCARLEGQPPELPLCCPCCGCKTLGERGGFEICDVCFWEDDGQDDYDAEVVRGGPNGAISLAQARVNYQRFGACDERAVGSVRPPTSAELPDANTSAGCED